MLKGLGFQLVQKSLLRAPGMLKASALESTSLCCPDSASNWPRLLSLAWPCAASVLQQSMAFILDSRGLILQGFTDAESGDPVVSAIIGPGQHRRPT